MTDSDTNYPHGALIGLALAALTFFSATIGLTIIGQPDPSTEPADATTCGSGTTTLKPPAPIAAAINEAAKTSGLPAAWLTAIANQESGFNPTVYASDANGGTWGLFQLNRAEWNAVYPHGDTRGTPTGITDPTTHARYAGIYFKNRLATVRKLKQSRPHEPFARLSDLDALLIAHNAGEGNLMHYPSIPAITKQYLANIHKNFTPTGATTCDTGVAGNGAADQKVFYAWLTHGGFTPGNPNLVVDPNQFYYGECTSYAAWAIKNHTRYKDFTNSWRGQHFGNASHWAAAARAAGITVDQKPAAGAIAQSLHAGGGVGHVAYITAVNPDGSFNIAESNYVRRHTFGTRSHVHLGHDFDNVLHFEK